MHITFLNSHPIQYFAPLYRELANRPDVDLTVLYCSAHGLEGELDREFGVEVKWDIPVLEGYRSVFLKNRARRPGIYGFWGLFNPEVISYLRRAPKGLLVVHGWGYLTNILALLAGRLTGHTVCLRGESPDCHERGRGKVALLLRKLIFGKMLFPLADRVLYIGKENRAFYLRYGVPDSKLVFAPYAVDNRRFGENYAQLAPRKAALRQSLGLPADKTIVLFSGKYIDKKRPLDLLRAFEKCKYSDRACLVFMGEGELRPDMERFIQEKKLADVHLTGFVNQSKVAEYYAAADIFTMCSQAGETWGLSTNEAMNFRLPLLLSDLTGSAADLVLDGGNGYVFETGNIEDYAHKLDLLLELPPQRLATMGEASGKRVLRYSYGRIIAGLLEAGGKADMGKVDWAGEVIDGSLMGH